MEQDAFVVRPATHSEMDIHVAWAAQEGWNPGLYDGDAFYQTDPEGFLLGLLDDKPIAAISVVRYGQTFAFLGFYIVHPDYRGQGYGLRIWNAGMARMAGRTVGLDGVVAQQDNYRRSGFIFAYNNVRYQGMGGGAAEHSNTIAELTPDAIDRICTYDAPFFPETRTLFLRNWLTQPESVSLTATEDGRIIGYGVIRPCQTGYKIGPLFADTVDAAEQIFLGLKSRAPERAPVFLDVPAPNTAAVQLAERYHMTPVFETARMYTPPQPELPVQRIFGVTSFELG